MKFIPPRPSRILLWFFTILFVIMVCRECYGQPIVDTLALVIADQEGWHRAGSPVRAWHNPGALVLAGQPGATAGPGGYARFADDEAGWSALRNDLRAKLRRGMSIPAIIRRWGADPELYLRRVTADPRMVRWKGDL